MFTCTSYRDKNYCSNYSIISFLVKWKLFASVDISFIIIIALHKRKTILVSPFSKDIFSSRWLYHRNIWKRLWFIHFDIIVFQSDFFCGRVIKTVALCFVYDYFLSLFFTALLYTHHKTIISLLDLFLFEFVLQLMWLLMPQA